MSDRPQAASHWIQGPFTDLFFFSFGWILALGAFVLVDHSGFGHGTRALLFVSVLLFNFLHRHLTFPLVYGDPEQFRQRRRSYLVLPVFFLALTGISVLYTKNPVLETDALPNPVRIASNASQDFVFFKGGSRYEASVRFRGDESTPEAVAATLNDQLAGWMQAEVAGDRLRLRAVQSGTRFHLGYSRGSTNQIKQLGLRRARGQHFEPTRPLFSALLGLAILWTIYHTVMQKVGLLRIYSRRAGAGASWTDKALPFAWLGVLIFHLGSLPSAREKAFVVWRASPAVQESLELAATLLPYLLVPCLAFAGVVSILHVREPLIRGARFSWPRTLYVFSIPMLYASFYYDVFVGYAVLGFSHAIEYLAFVNVYARRKYLSRSPDSSLLARAVRHQGAAMAGYCLVVLPAFVLWNSAAPISLEWYIVGSGFLHFIYDGWIWKLRKPEVGKPLGLDYAQPAHG